MAAEHRNKGPNDLIERILAQHQIAAPITEESFEISPLSYRAYPHGLDKPGTFYANPIPMAVPDLLALVQEKGAVEFLTTRFTAVPVLDGKSGMALWMNLDGLRKKDGVRTWARRLCHGAVARNPELLTLDVGAKNADRVYVRSVVGLLTFLPCGLRAPSLAVTIPVTWSELDSFAGADAVGIDDFPRRSTNYPLHKIGGSHGIASQQ